MTSKDPSCGTILSFLNFYFLFSSFSYTRMLMHVTYNFIKFLSFAVKYITFVEIKEVGHLSSKSKVSNTF